MWIHLCDLEIKRDRKCVISSVLNTIKRFLLLKIYYIGLQLEAYFRQ